MKRRICLLIAVVAVFSCQRTVQRPNGTLVASSVYPMYDILKNIAGEGVNVIHAVPVGANPHTYEPLPSDVQRLLQVRLFIGIHPDFDGWMEDYLSKECRTVYLMEHEGKHHHRSEDHAHHHEDNPHIWLSVKGIMGYVDELADVLSQTFPAHEERIERNSLDFKAQLDELDEELDGHFSDVKHRAFLQWHPAWDQFAEDYGLEIAGTVEHGHGDTPSVKEFQNLLATAKRENVGVIVISLNVESKAVKSLARESGVEILRLDTIGNPKDETRDTYIDLMRQNGHLLAEALSR